VPGFLLKFSPAPDPRRAAMWLLTKNQEFKRGPDKNVYHHGHPICLRTPGVVSIQISLT